MARGPPTQSQRSHGETARSEKAGMWVYLTWTYYMYLFITNTRFSNAIEFVYI